MRCAACRETWFLTSDEVSTALVTEAAPQVEREETPTEIFEALRTQEGLRESPDFGETNRDGSEEKPAENPPAPARRRAKRKPATAVRASRQGMKWPALAAGLVLFVMLPLALLARNGVVQAVPQSASLFSAIGLPVNLRGVDLRDVAAFRIAAQGDRPAELVVEGDLVGVARERVEVPPVEVEIRDAQGHAVYRWTVPPPRAALEPAETARFRASLSAPPDKGRHVEVRFASNEAPPPKADAHDEPGKGPAKSQAAAPDTAHPAPDTHSAAPGGH